MLGSHQETAQKGFYLDREIFFVLLCDKNYNLAFYFVINLHIRLHIAAVTCSLNTLSGVGGFVSQCMNRRTSKGRT
jgi:hypothetical protein